MPSQPECLVDRSTGRPKVSVILIDWAARESFHALEYLNRQTAPRDSYELVWVEFYDHVPDGLRRAVAAAPSDRPAVDRWLKLGYPRGSIYHKHRAYNAGLLASRGDVCVICDSDAIFAPTFIASIQRAFAESPRSVVHLDEVRNVRQDLYPFRYPTIEEVLGPGCINWRGHTTLGLDGSPDPLHHANYGACMAARRADLLAIGGADEDLDYLGYVCGPYEMTFRLVNYGRRERWLTNEYLYHTWHPNQYGFNTERHGPHDGAHMALLSLDAKASFRVEPSLPNPWVARARRGQGPTLDELLTLVRDKDEPAWRADAGPVPDADRVWWVERDYFGFNVFCHRETWYALPAPCLRPDPARLRAGDYRPLWQAKSQNELHERLSAHHDAWLAEVNNLSLAGRLWRKFQAQPLHRLPGRVARKVRTVLARG